jgi:uncharacterized protein
VCTGSCSLAEFLERVKGFEPSTSTLARLRSTPELHPRSVCGCTITALTVIARANLSEKSTYIDVLISCAESCARSMSVPSPTLPAELPVFPLRGVLLLPGGRLPLTIFEPRYVAMTTDALAMGRLIGMIQPQDPGNLPLPEDMPLPLYTIGCAGRIVSFEETSDGRFLITLLGVSRFRLVQETSAPPLAYRRFAVDWSVFSADRDPDTPAAGSGLPERQGFIATACRYLEREGMRFDAEAIQDAPLDRLATAIAMICKFSPGEKQALLEAPDASHRTQMLFMLMEMALHQCGEGSGAPQLN